jgi:hypothetical protein
MRRPHVHIVIALLVAIALVFLWREIGVAPGPDRAGNFSSSGATEASSASSVR